MKNSTTLPTKLVCRLPSADCRLYFLEEVAVFPFSFCLIKKKQKIKATKIPPAQSDRLTNATLASKTALIFLPFFLSCCGFSNRLPTSVRKSLQTFTLFRLTCGLGPRTCAVVTIHVRHSMLDVRR